MLCLLLYQCTHIMLVIYAKKEWYNKLFSLLYPSLQWVCDAIQYVQQLYLLYTFVVQLHGPLQQGRAYLRQQKYVHTPHEATLNTTCKGWNSLYTYSQISDLNINNNQSPVLHDINYITCFVGKRFQLSTRCEPDPTPNSHICAMIFVVVVKSCHIVQIVFPAGIVIR